MGYTSNNDTSLIWPGCIYAASAVQECTIGEGHFTCVDEELLTQLLETAAGKASGDVGKQFDAAVANNLTTVRMFGFGTMGGFALQSSIGSYNEQAFQAFDKVSVRLWSTHIHPQKALIIEPSPSLQWHLSRCCT